MNLFPITCNRWFLRLLKYHGLVPQTWGLGGLTSPLPERFGWISMAAFPGHCMWEGCRTSMRLLSLACCLLWA